MDRFDPQPRRLNLELQAGRMAAIGFGEAGRPTDLVFLHAAGFNAHAYRSLLEPLGAKLGVIAPDLRGHGRTTLPARRLGYDSWNTHRDDVIALINQLETAVVLAGHSMGAVVALLVAGKRPDLVRGVCLLDPVIAPPAFYSSALLPGAVFAARHGVPIARRAGKRRSSFPNRQAALEALMGRGIFAAMTSEQISDYLVDGVLKTDAGDVRLACAPAYERATFAAQRHDPWAAAAKAPSPMVVLRAERGSTMPQSSVARLAALRPDARIATIEGATHALPWDRADRARAGIETAAVMAPRLAAYRDVY